MLSDKIQEANDKFTKAKNGMEYFNVLNRKNANKEFSTLLLENRNLLDNWQENEAKILEVYKQMTDLITE
jgi:hypothetical protein